MFFRSRKNEEPPAMTLEGVLGPNGRLDAADGIRVNSPEALCITGDGQLLFTSGKAVYSLRAWGRQPELWRAFDLPVSALCCSPGGLVAVGLATGQIVVCDGSGRSAGGWTLPARLASVVDCLFLSEDE